MLGLGIGLAGTLAAFHFAKRAGGPEGGPLVVVALALAALDALGMVLLAFGVL